MPSPPVPAVTPSVETGDVIKLDITDKTPVMNLTWTQGMKDRKADYYAGNYQNITKPGQGSFIFVQTDMLEEFKKHQSADGNITIDTSFQYGQRDKTGADRWIVFHDKTKNKPYQKRFVAGAIQTYQAYGQTVADVLGKLGLKPGQALGEFLTSTIEMIGNYLHDFEEKKK